TMLSLMGWGAAASALGFQQALEPAAITLRIQEVAWELAPRRTVRTTAYNGQVPGPFLRLPEGKPVTVEVQNDTGREELVHWHGLRIPSDVDGAYEEGTPAVPPRGSRRYTFTPTPAGTRWYHTHIPSGRNLRIGTYTGQFGLMVVEPASDPGRYDLEVPLLLHEWDAAFTREGPHDIEYKLFSINGHLLGAGEPIRVRPSQRVLFRVVNASATLHHRLALAGHRFRVVALDGNPLPRPALVPRIELSPGERVDAIVEMNNPGVWILGELNDAQRSAGMGVVVEYREAHGPPRWLPPAAGDWDYAAFAEPGTAAAPDERLPLVIRQPEGSTRWTINGQSHPQTTPLHVELGRRYRLIFDNQSAEAHPMHLHRHNFEMVRFNQRPLSGIFKDVVIVPAWKQVEVDFIADNPGPTLLHCHQQFHMDSGLMTMIHYSG
ncbi:MAG TPA: multicopper oxidase family protein, partial [Terriglobia bacterium]|nr:multicopper oxidase family protein [Terriglobia bacterium]